MSCIAFRRFAFGFLVAAVACPLRAEPYAFISVSGPSIRAIQVLDLETMAVETSIGGLGDEPGRMVANADRSLIWLSSWRDLPGPSSEGLVHLVDTASRQVLATRVVGLSQNRTIALSPDESRVYTWKLELVDGIATLGVAVLDADTLEEITVVPITGPNCPQFASQIAVGPDGRIVAAACSDGLRIIDPVTFAVTIGAPTPLSVSPVFGFSPDGGEVYVTAGGTVGAGTGLLAIDLATGAGTEFHWQVADGSPGFPQGSGPTRMIVVQRPADPPGDPTVFFTYNSATGNTPVAWARASDLVPHGTNPRNRRLIGRAALGPASSLGAALDGTLGLGARTGAIRRMRFDGPPSGDAIVTDGDALAFTGISNLTDIIIVPGAVDSIFAHGFE